MYKSFRIGDYRFWVSVRRVGDMKGMCSELEDGKHILMWDFDDVSLANVRDALWEVQTHHWLPKVYILETRRDRSYIAYCFTRYSWERAVSIVAETLYVDWVYFKLSVFRGFFTLRYTPKRGREPKLVSVLQSDRPEQATVDDLMRALRYETNLEK